MGAYSTSNGSTEDPTPARSFFSRFSLPIRSRSRNLADFHIRPVDPHRQYSAGDHVHGAVVLAIVKPIRITHLTVALHGFVRVHKSPAGTEPVTNPSLAGRGPYHGTGYASLFQDEQVLSGEGRLEAGKYEFNFDLVFPEKGLPSSIDFERGTISYMVTATLTRPTSISPTTTCDRKISLVEKVDIGPLAPPRARTIYLEPISKRAKKRRPTGSEKAPATLEAQDQSDDQESAAEPTVLSEEPTQDLPNLPRSPVQADIRSEFSGESSVSTSTGLSLRGADAAQATNSAIAANAKMQAVDEKTITATIELLKGGCLPGDTISVKVSVQHIKRIKSMHGVIVTMFRQGRIDSAPPTILLANKRPKDDAKRLEKETLYPRSRTGLGGLTLSSTTSLSVFRKDLSQAVAPLIIDPVKLDTTVTASVKVPEDVFPTIKGVPGDMISFKYQLEVLVDLGGRLASQIQGGGQSRMGQFAPTQGASEGNNAVITSWGGNVIDTDRLRREKGVISVVFEVIVGSVDSTRVRGRGGALRTYQMPEASASQDDMMGRWDGEDVADTDEGFYPETTPYYHPPLSRQATGLPETEAPAYIAPPEIPNDNELTEKERVRRQEQRLLPSQPPQASDAGPSGASAPELNIYDADDETPQEPRPAYDDIVRHGPSAPTLDDLSSSAAAQAADDKRELERQRLLIEASSPPEFPEDYEAGPSRVEPPTGNLEPSAPTLGDDEEYGTHYAYISEARSPLQAHPNGSEPLPRYER